MRKQTIFLTSALGLLLAACNEKPGNAETDSSRDSAQQASFHLGNIKEQMVYDRGVAAAVWGITAVNYRLMYAAMEKLQGGFNQVVWWPKLLDWKNQTLTPNQDVIYLMPFFNTKDVGPVVLEIPPADSGIFNGSIM